MTWAAGFSGGRVCSCTRAWLPGLAEGFSRSVVFATTADTQDTPRLFEGMMGRSTDCMYLLWYSAKVFFAGYLDFSSNPLVNNN